MKKLFVEVKNGGKMTYSVSDLNKLDRMYETEVFERKEKRVMSPFKKEMQKSFQAQVRDYAFEKILDRHLYTFKYLLVIPNPYGLAKQTALILFNSSKECKVVYRVIGDTPDCDFTGETEYTTRHRVPILGLYGGRNNKIDLSLVDKNGETVKHRVIQIYVSPIQENIRNMVSETDTKMSQFGFIMLNTAIGSPVAIDRNGDVRYSIQIKTGKLGMIPLANGHFLLVDKTANRIDKYGRVTPCRYHEMDYMGRVYRTYLLEYRIGRAITQHGDSLFFVTASDDGHLSDRIAELNLKTGELIKYCDIHSIVGDKYRVYGELINTYGYNIEAGAKSFTALNYYTNEEISIPLDDTLTPIENANKYFARYNKLKRTYEAGVRLIEEIKDEIMYLESIINALDIATTENDLNNIKEELIITGYIKKNSKSKSKDNKNNKPLHYISSDGFDMYVGKNNLQNDELTFKFASNSDWWFHAKQMPGSHVIVKTNGKELPDRTFEEAAALAAYYSKGRDLDKVEVDYVLKKEVKKPAAAKPGFVVYYTNYSLIAIADIKGIKQVTG